MGDGSPNVTRFAPPLASAQREKLARHGVWVPTIQWSTPHFNTPLRCGENWRGPEFSRALEIFGRVLYEPVSAITDLRIQLAGPAAVRRRHPVASSGDGHGRLERR